MKVSRHGSGRLALGAAAVLLLAAGVSHSGIAKAADGPIPCSAFGRGAAGSWRVLAPVTLNLDGRLYSPMVGTTFAAGSTQRGIEMSDVLDQQCGNR